MKATTAANIVYIDKEFEVGITTALVIFDDGREVHTKFYGSVDQFVDKVFLLYNIPKPITVSEPYVTTSVEAYKAFLFNLDPNSIEKIVDDPQDPTVAWTGRVAHLEIVETVPHKITYRVSVLEEVKDETPADPVTPVTS
jgi:hypothetical protein